MSISRRVFVKTAMTLSAATAAGGLLAACAQEEQSASVERPEPEETASEVDNTPAATREPVETPEAEEAAPASDAAAAAPVLVAYYTNTGNTGRVAEVIAQEMQADTFLIECMDPYTAEDVNWRDENSRVSQEMPRRSEVDVELVSVTPPDWDSYKTVFVGCPIWWQSFSWVMNDFVRQNSFQGKTVIPFFTSSSSPLGESDTAMAAEADGGDWLPGMRFSSGASEEEIRQWLESLPL
ncbi:flavodoxin [Adlercreutzia equolifaciens]|uniref:flavodoxin n=1 Tax=Adlercreutzia equolifaciens TaxID=446660 RepID=UPI0023AFAB2E|nr:flavodoxin [Adlercreutzia equolifaciens]MDE8701369.1 flavodoxin [Adlercreutzia equolifaciens]